MKALRFGFLLVAILLFFSTDAVSAPANSSRIKTSLDAGWRFMLGDPQNAAAPDLDDRAWQAVNVPHTWNVSDAFDDEPGYHRGPAWYRRQLNVGRELVGRRLFLYLEGANQVADVFVNGRNAGRHIGGYTAFATDITEFVKPGANMIAVRVDNSFNEDIPPLTADFNFYGGIYRDVWLIATRDLHFEVTDHASPGVKITTPDISNGKGTVAIESVITNDDVKRKSFEVVSTLFDPTGRVVGSARSTTTVEAKSEIKVTGRAVVAGPKLWSPDAPYLYRVSSKILENGKAVDEIAQPLGFRWFRFDPDTGFYLNGKHLKLRGTNRHQDYAGLGNAVPDRLHIRDMELIKSAGFNFVRLAHYPQDPSVLEAADRLGLLIWEEIPLVNYITRSAAFTENSLDMLKDMIRQHRNHPSVILWGYMNEIFLRVPKERDDLYPATVALARELNSAAHDEDPTRPTTMACHGSDIYNEKGLADVPDVLGWNLYLGWYGGKMEDFGKYLDDQHRRFPKRPLIVSEYGANGDVRLHSTKPRRFDSTTEYQREFHESYLSQIDARPYLSGSTLWSEFDFGSEFRGETKPHINQKGMFTIVREPKDVHFFYKASLSREPVVHIAVGDWKYRAGTSGKRYRIEVYSNLPAVELFQNGVPLGRKSIDGSHKATWDLQMHGGTNRLTATGRKGARTITDAAEVDYRVVTTASPEIAVNVGSNADFIDEQNRVWLADQPYTAGSWGFIGDSAKWIYSSPPDRNILGTTDDPVYQTMQEGLSSYKFDVPDGNYEVELLFAETKFEQLGERVFSVRINGKTVIENLDVAATAKPRHAFDRKFTTAANGGLTVEFVPVVGEPVLSGIRVVRR
jgi:beta-galactosidase